MASTDPSAPAFGEVTQQEETMQQNQPPPYAAANPSYQQQYPQGGAAYPPSGYAQGQYPPPAPGQYPGQAQGQYPPPAPGGAYYPPTGQAANWGKAATQQHMTSQQQTSQVSSDWDQAENGGEEPFTAFSEKSIRLAFVRKVFAILAIMLVATGGIMCIFMFVDDVNEYVQRNNWVYITSVCVYLVAVFTLICAGDLRRKVPLNFVFLGIVTVSMGCMLGTIATYYETREILIAVGIVVIVTIGMVALGFQNKVDFTAANGIMCVATLCLIGFGFMALIFRSDILYIFYASLGALLFSIWIVIDVQMMMGGKHKFSISPEEYVVAALNLYLDIVNLFLYLLMIIKGTN